MDNEESEVGIFLREIPLSGGHEKEFPRMSDKKLESERESLEECAEERIAQRWRRWLDIADL